MKYVIFFLLMLSNLVLAKNNDNMTDIESTREYSKEVQNLQTSNYQCNLYIERTGINLHNMSKAEEENNKKTISKEFLLFKKNSQYAIEYCSYISKDATDDMILIQDGVTQYYNEVYLKH